MLHQYNSSFITVAQFKSFFVGENLNGKGFKLFEDLRGIMNNSSLIIYTLKQALYCCCFVRDSLMACCSSKAVMIWDFAEGILRLRHDFSEQLAPIYITLIPNEESNMLLMQLKDTKVIIFQLDNQSLNLTPVSSYHLDMIGFTKLSIPIFCYNQQQDVARRIKDHFFTISYPDKIEKRQLFKGNKLQEYDLDQTKIQAVSFLLTYEIEEMTYFLVAEEGGTFKQFIIPDEQAILEVNKQLTIPSKQQIKIVLSIQPMNHFLAYVCLRNDSIFIINLKSLQLERNLPIKSFRLVKYIPLKDNKLIFAASNKNQICLLQDNILKSRQKVEKSFILDIDTFELGAIGVTEQGKIIFLPIL